MGIEGFDGYGWLWIDVDGLGWMWMTSDGCGWPEMGLEGFRWMWMAWDGWREPEMVMEALPTHLTPSLSTLAIHTFPCSFALIVRPNWVIYGIFFFFIKPKFCPTILYGIKITWKNGPWFPLGETLGKGMPLYGRASHGVGVLLVWTLVRWDVLQVNSTCGVCKFILYKSCDKKK